MREKIKGIHFINSTQTIPSHTILESTNSTITQIDIHHTSDSMFVSCVDHEHSWLASISQCTAISTVPVLHCEIYTIIFFVIHMITNEYIPIPHSTREYECTEQGRNNKNIRYSLLELFYLHLTSSLLLIQLSSFVCIFLINCFQIHSRFLSIQISL